ncbi:polyketide cyclase/dehydrase/lipid transport protein [Murinocardiopsis flavida]|uniref:Polyketide cyclase/dehydrase/lipid transport protein n=1 Tax=Murinocardiopsis flavida TaxID=645275 RepID=A0A2P8CR86_9ACTN|nr:SRPBCC family protein [Murinocardiopsis flavida]PSK87478.1 polyketide cyclase/dehydrase/lipid transport protein [Murinocardiopsis flavida]
MVDTIVAASDVPDASADRLWSLVGDLPAWGAMLPSVDSVRRLGAAEVPIGVGARFAVRQPGLPAAVYEVTEWSPGRSFTWVARSPGVVTTCRHIIEAEGAGSRLRLSIEWTGPLAGLVRLLIAGKARRMVESEAATFARLAQSA